MNAEPSRTSTPERCRACGSGELEPHLRVRGEAGHEGLIPTTDRYGTALDDIARCAACGHMQLARMPARAALVQAYGEAASDAYLAEEEGQRRTARRILAAIEGEAAAGAGSSAPAGGDRILDLGCWLGFLLAEARDRGWEAVGVEPSAYASEHARERLGLDVRTGDLLGVDLPASSFDAVFMGDVLEHLPDPALAVDRAREWLVPDGVLALALPDAGARLARALGARWWSVIPTHLQYFTRESLALLVERRGFEVVSIRTAPKTFTVRYYLGRLGGYRRRAAGALVAAAERAGLADRLWTPDLRDRMLVLARPAAGTPRSRGTTGSG